MDFLGLNGSIHLIILKGLITLLSNPLIVALKFTIGVVDNNEQISLSGQLALIMTKYLLPVPY